MKRDIRSTRSFIKELEIPRSTFQDLITKHKLKPKKERLHGLICHIYNEKLQKLIRGIVDAHKKKLAEKRTNSRSKTRRKARRKKSLVLF